MDWSDWRAEFPVTRRRVHLNHAGVSPLPRRVVQAIHRFTEEALVPDPESYARWERRGEEARACMARLVGARADEIAFVPSTSAGLSLVGAGLDWRAGDNVVAVDGDYPSNIYPWFGLRRHGVETRLVRPVGGRVRAEDVRDRLDGRTRLLAVSFVDWQLGGRTDLATLATLCRERDVLLCVDGIQGVGALQLDVEREGVDCLAAGGYKWQLSPEGTGFLFVSRRVVDRIQPVLLGWKSVCDADSFLPYHFELRPDAAKLEPGGPPQLEMQMHGAAAELLLEIGLERIERRIFELTDHLRDGLRARGLEVLSPWGASERSGIVTFRCGENPAALCEELSRRGFVVRPRGGGVRVAPHFYNEEDELDRFLATLDELR